MDETKVRIGLQNQFYNTHCSLLKLPHSDIFSDCKGIIRQRERRATFSFDLQSFLSTISKIVLLYPQNS